MDYTLLDNFMYNNVNTIELISKNEKETQYIAKYIAKFTKTKDVIVLNGELGSGKTLFTTGFATYFNVENQVSSPTFTIVNEYISNNQNIYHFDVYKIKSIEEFESTIGLDYFDTGISIIEWGNILQNILPINTIYIDIQKLNESTRKLIISRRTI